MEGEKVMKSQSLNRIIWNRLKNDNMFLVSFFFIVMLTLISAFPYVFMKDKSQYANEMNLDISTIPPLSKVSVLTIDDKKIFASDVKVNDLGISFFSITDSKHMSHKGEFSLVNKVYYFGTDKFGRDLYSRILYATRISMSIGLISVLISLIIGTLLGAFAGYFGGKIDNFIMWFVNVIWSIPTLLIVIAITLALGKGYWQVFVAVGLTMWVEIARVIRGEFIAQRNHEYVEAARVLGFSNLRIIFKHILPNVIAPVIVISAANFAAAILIEAGLSFLGIGTQPPIPSWGGMIKDHYNYIIMDKAYLAIIPGLCIMFSVLSFMIFGNGLRSSIDTD